MRWILSAVFVCASALASLPGAALAQAMQQRLALVIGESAYRSGALPTPANDASLMADTLRTAGFNVTGARDLDQDGLRRALRDFLASAQAAGPDAVAFVYVAGHSIQYAGENYIVPVDATLQRDASVPIETVRLSDFTRALAGTPLKARFVVIDGARANTFVRTGPALASGLALVEADQGSLIAFNAAPGTIAPDGAGPYGPYAEALVEMMRTPGLPVDDVFARTRLRVNETTKGVQVPWHTSRIDAPFVFFGRAANAPALPPVANLRSKPIRDFSASDAYAQAIERDTLAGYQEFIRAYPNDRLTKRVRAMLAARREALTWSRTVRADTPNAYWTYLRRYGRTGHAEDARRRLSLLSAALEPPRVFEYYVYDIEPPQDYEIVYVDRPVLIFSEPDFGPPPPQSTFLPPRPEEFRQLSAPPPSLGLGLLPLLLPIPVPVGARPVPVGVIAPPANVQPAAQPVPAAQSPAAPMPAVVPPVPPVAQTPPALIVPPVVQTPPVVIVPPVVQTPPALIVPPVVQTPPVVVIPPVVQTPPVVKVPPVVQTPPAVIIPPVVQTPPAVIVPPVVQTPPVLKVPPIVQTPVITPPPVVKALPNVNSPPVTTVPLPPVVKDAPTPPAPPVVKAPLPPPPVVKAPLPPPAPPVVKAAPPAPPVIKAPPPPPPPPVVKAPPPAPPVVKAPPPPPPPAPPVVKAPPPPPPPPPVVKAPPPPPPPAPPVVKAPPPPPPPVVKAPPPTPKPVPAPPAKPGQQDCGQPGEAPCPK